MDKIKVTQYPAINQFLDLLVSRITATLGDKLVGLYLEGSLVAGDFEPGISDIDLLAALTSDIDHKELEALEVMHAEFVAEFKEWYDRLEVCYISVQALKKARTFTGPFVNISPGEPLHRLEANKKWLLRWYLAREESKTLYGPAPASIIEPISKEEFIECVKSHAEAWGEWVQDMRNPYAQSYAILSMCRAWYSCKNNGGQISKKKAALLAQQELPEWSEVIGRALVSRQGGKYLQADDVTHPETVRFVNHVRSLILAE